jgi:antirestriction protein ArdC
MTDQAAEALIGELGISHPSEIDLDAIAYVLGVTVKYEPLEGCEALIVGSGDRAIATVNRNSSLERQRFSLAHELGHWAHHRGHTLYCLQADIEANSQKARETELIADRYASSLLMPNFLFRPALANHKKLSWKAIREIAKEFRSSPLATILRVVDLNVAPAIFVMSQGGKRLWFRRSRDISDVWFPKDSPDPESFAFDLSFDSNKLAAGPRKVGADAWFDRWNADRLEVIEDSIRVGDCVYSILLLEDESFCRD